MTRTSSDILLELESKIDLLTDLVRAQDLNIKILSNKLKYAIDNGSSFIPKQESIASAKPYVEAVQAPIEQIKATPLPTQDAVSGVRRTSRSESYTGKTLNPLANNSAPPKVDTTPVISAIETPSVNVIVKDEVKQLANNPVGLTSALVQKVVDKHNKAVFLAEVEVINSTNGEIVSKVKTNSAGNWSATLAAGSYKILIRKRESISKQALEMTQNIIVDGSSYNLKLPTVTLK